MSWCSCSISPWRRPNLHHHQTAVLQSCAFRNLVDFCSALGRSTVLCISMMAIITIQWGTRCSWPLKPKNRREKYERWTTREIKFQFLIILVFMFEWIETKIVFWKFMVLWIQQCCDMWKQVIFSMESRQKVVAQILKFKGINHRCKLQMRWAWCCHFNFSHYYYQRYPMLWFRCSFKMKLHCCWHNLGIIMNFKIRYHQYTLVKMQFWQVVATWTQRASFLLLQSVDFIRCQKSNDVMLNNLFLSLGITINELQCCRKCTHSSLVSLLPLSADMLSTLIYQISVSVQFSNIFF